MNQKKKDNEEVKDETVKTSAETPDEDKKSDTGAEADKNSETIDALDLEADVDPEFASKKIKKLESELKEKDDRYLRMAAEYDNFRRRSREERDGVYASAVADTVSELLPIIDNLERACGYDDGEKVKEGLVLTVKTVDAALEKIGVCAFGAPGDTFDPNLHNAVMHVDDEQYGENVIVEVFQKGYKKGNKVIRFAMVKTAN